MQSLWPYGILGGGDLVIAWAIIGALNCGVSRCEEDFPELHAMLQRYVQQLDGLRLGFLPGTLLHHFHGERHHRGYQSSWEILRKWKYNPEKHVRFDAEGVLVPTEACSPQMLEDVREYFRSRREDDAGEEMHDESMPDDSALTSRLPVSLRPKITSPALSTTSPPASVDSPVVPSTPLPPAVPSSPPLPPTPLPASTADASFVHVGECSRLLHYYWPIHGAEEGAETDSSG